MQTPPQTTQPRTPQPPLALQNATLETTLTQHDTIQRSPSPAHSQQHQQLNTRRNLFGIRLNHDQLQQDLTEMWKEQVDRQNQNWGFDFQKLKPLDKNSTKRFEWIKVNTRMNPFYNETGK